MNETEAMLWKHVRGRCLDPNARAYDLTALSDALGRLIAEVGNDELPDRIATLIGNGIFTPTEGSLLIDVASYSTDDEGSRIRRVLEQWLEAGANEARIALALSPGTIPFRSRARRVAVLTAIAQQFPQFANRCQHLIEASRDA